MPDECNDYCDECGCCIECDGDNGFCACCMANGKIKLARCPCGNVLAYEDPDSLIICPKCADILVRDSDD